MHFLMLSFQEGQGNKNPRSGFILTIYFFQDEGFNALKKFADGKLRNWNVEIKLLLHSSNIESNSECKFQLFFFFLILLLLNLYYLVKTNRKFNA